MIPEFDRQFKVKVAGVDEVGRGPLAGPVVSAAVVIENEEELKDVRDSKKIAEKKREILYNKILNNAKVGIGIVTAEEIDSTDILSSTMKSMRESLKNLKADFELVLVDGNLKIRDLKLDQRAIVKGDSKSLSIAAASIVAKVTRDRMMIEYGKKYKEYMFHKNKGYGTKDHIDAIKRVGITEIHRKSFLKNYL